MIRLIMFSFTVFSYRNTQLEHMGLPRFYVTMHFVVLAATLFATIYSKCGPLVRRESQKILAVIEREERNELLIMHQCFKVIKKYSKRLNYRVYAL